jgi:hypothetical protein
VINATANAVRTRKIPRRMTVSHVFQDFPMNHELIKIWLQLPQDKFPQRSERHCDPHT